MSSHLLPAQASGHLLRAGDPGADGAWKDESLAAPCRAAHPCTVMGNYMDQAAEMLQAWS